MAKDVTVGRTGPIHEEHRYETRECHDRAQVFLQPIAAPSILGLFGFAGATLMVGAYLAGLYGQTQTPLYLLPFAAFFGGLAQFLAAMWAYRARDGLATAVHGMWGSFWMSYGLLYLLFAFGLVTPPTGAFPELAFWFVVLACITIMAAIAAMAVNWGMVGVLAPLASAAILAAAGLWIANPNLMTIAGWLFIVSAIIAWYTASAMMMESTFGRAILPLGRTKHARELPRISVGAGEPGVTHGQ